MTTDRLYDADYTGPRWRYGYRLRPPGIACQPPGFILMSDRPHPMFRHGTRDWPAPLSPEDADHFDLVLVEALSPP